MTKYENNCAVYVHVNLINGKKYFGITTQNPPENRWKNGSGYRRNVHFANAIKKFGWDNFGHYILYRDIPIKIAKNIEEMLIKEYMSYDPNFGYNKTMGGELERQGEESRRKMSENNAMKRPEVAEKVSKALKEYYKNHPEAREVLSEKAKEQWNDPELREAHSERMKERHEKHPEKHPMKRPEVVAKVAAAQGKPVEALDLKSGQRVLYFKSIMDAQRAGFNSSHISACCNKKRKTHAGLIWQFIREVNKDDPNSGQ